MRFHPAGLAVRFVLLAFFGADVDAAALGSNTADDTELTTVWDGVYTVEQARRGQRVYAAECGECHLDDLMGDGDAPAVAGTIFFVRWGDLSIADMVDATRATMPQFGANSLTTKEYVDIAAYMLEASDLPSGEKELSTEMDELAQIIVVEEPEE